jgi:transcriptional regulator with XRE-family HTH domain
MAKRYRGPKGAKVRLDGVALRSKRIADRLTIEAIVGTGDRFSEATYKRAEKGKEISHLKAEEIAAAFGADLDAFLAKGVPARAAEVQEDRPLVALEHKREVLGRRRNASAPPMDPDVFGYVKADQLDERFQFLRVMVELFVTRYRQAHKIDLTVSLVPLFQACSECFRDAMRLEPYSTDPNYEYSLDLETLGALTCYHLARKKPIVVTNTGDQSNPS